MTPEEYRAKWGLPADYPMVAANYAARIDACRITRPTPDSAIASTILCFHADEHNANCEGAVGLNLKMRFRWRLRRYAP
jgi:hypothetical protein